ncbi:MAG: chromate transporter, partial [Pseudomonadota bacterium]
APFPPSVQLLLRAAPDVARLTANPRLAGAHAGITAAVVGAIASLAVAVAVAVLWPDGGGYDYRSAGIALLAFKLLLRTRLDVVWVLLLGAALGGLGALAG